MTDAGGMTATDTFVYVVTAAPEPTGGTVTGVVFNDANGNGAMDANELGGRRRPGLPGRERERLARPGRGQRPTAAGGVYALATTADGTYPVRIVLPANTQLTTASGSVALTGGERQMARPSGSRPTRRGTPNPQPTPPTPYAAGGTRARRRWSRCTTPTGREGGDVGVRVELRRRRADRDRGRDRRRHPRPDRRALPGRVAEVRVYDGVTGQLVHTFVPFDWA